MRVLSESANDMKEIYEIWTALESQAVEILARRKPSEAELRPLLEATRDMARALKVDNLDAWAEADERFHTYLIEVAGNRLLVQAVQQYWDRVHRARMITLRLRPKPETSTKEHRALVEHAAQRQRKGRSPGKSCASRARQSRTTRNL
jgi:DNA-binding GntR family transcriptional regulator